MIKLLPFLALVLSASADAQTYEISAVKRDGFHAATLEETVAVIRQETGSPSPYYQTIKNLVDQERGHTTIAKEFSASIVALMEKLSAPNPLPGFYAFGHGEGAITVHVHGGGTTLRYRSDVLPVNLFVKQVAPTPKPQLKVTAAFLKMFLEMLDEEGRAELARQLAEYDVIIVPDNLVE